MPQPCAAHANVPSYKTVRTAALIPYARNARTHSEEQVAQIAASIREFGFTNPVLTDGDNGIIAGHGRVLAARKLGLAEVPVIELAHLTTAQRKAYVLADNKLALNAGWDAELLRLELAELQDLGFDLDLTGFDADEIAEFLADPTTGLTDPDDVPALPEEPVTRPGDVWLLGRHRLICGDCTDPAVVAAVLGSVGVPRRQIAKYFGLQEAELAARLGDELEQAEVDANSKVAKALFTMATQKNNVAAAIFWMKARAGWRERQEISATLEAASVPCRVIGPFPQITKEEWLAQIALRRAG